MNWKQEESKKKMKDGILPYLISEQKLQRDSIAHTFRTSDTCEHVQMKR